MTNGRHRNNDQDHRFFDAVRKLSGGRHGVAGTDHGWTQDQKKMGRIIIATTTATVIVAGSIFLIGFLLGAGMVAAERMLG